jgi:signal transduction histidine kinase
MTMNSSPTSQSIRFADFSLSDLLPIAVAVYQALAAATLAVALILVLQTFSTPFIGAFVENTLVVHANDPMQPGSWMAKNAGFRFGDRLESINGQEINQVGDYLRALEGYQVGDQVTLTATSMEGESVSATITLQSLPPRDRTAYFFVPWAIAIIYLGSGLWVFSIRHNQATGRTFAFFTASVAIATAGIFDLYTTNRLTYFWTISLALTGGALFHLAWVFPQKSKLLKRWPFLRWVGYGIALLLVAITLPALFDTANPYRYITLWRLIYAFVGLAVLFFVGMAAYHSYQAKSLLVRQQGRIIHWGAILAFIPMAIWLLISALHPDVGFIPFLVLPLAIFPLATGYAILRYQLLDTDVILSRATTYAILGALVASGYALLVSGINIFVGGTVEPSNPYLIGGVTFLLALGLNPVRTRLENLVDSIFLRGQRTYRHHLQAFENSLGATLELEEIAALVRKTLEETLFPQQVHVFLIGSQGEFYMATEDESGVPTTELRFAVDGSLSKYLLENETFLLLDNKQKLPGLLREEKARLALLGAEIFTPLVGRGKQLLGFIALTPRESELPYSNQDLNFISTLSEKAAINIERTQVIADLERHVNEMNVLMRVARGINVTPQLDDILELVYAQTNNLIPTRDFWILLYNQERDAYRYAFYLENDLRMLEHEHRSVEEDKGLAQEIVKTQRPIATDDYERACQQRGRHPLVAGLHAWAGVPLNTQSETIGAMCLASRDPAKVYSNDELTLLQTIADQAAGAIVKTQLLDETERRARQLSMLNEISRNLTSTLELPKLLNQILENAVEITNCEAGTLFLVDEDTDEIIFKVVTGPVADDLVGERLPPGTGQVGQAILSREAAIINDVSATKTWSQQTDEKTGFETKDMLLVPMIAQDEVIGVIEVINRRDGFPFTMDDQSLLTAFSSQAAVALVNARLYTRTDEKLASRVDELSVMQRIDRELNASLDIHRAMRITLEWAMRQSGADAGLVGSVEEEGVNIMAEQGYDGELASYRETRLPLDNIPGLESSVGEAATQIFKRSEMVSSSKQVTLLEGTNAQLVYPIRREDQVIGVLLLESRSEEPPWTDETQEFLSRLSDHAAIAIANAQLFDQVQSANTAKSDFVSLVAHELKNPMTSIRGYTDLLIKGAIGEISKGQEDFLRTIRANVNRMTTLVSDLADISRIEAERLRLDFKAVNINDVVDEVVRSHRNKLEEKEQTLNLNIPENLPPVWGDHTRLVQILVNLVSNANKYTPEGGEITIRAERSPNQWDPEGAKEVLLIAVEDNGIGLKPEDQSKIFTKFFRSDDPKATDAPGTGLGLNISRNLVEMQGGKIWFESEYREGTTFYLTVPVAQI